MKKPTVAAMLITCACMLAPPAGWAANARVESNVVYGMYSGLALFVDIYYPEKPNGYGIVYISGSGWHASQEYSAQPLKESGQAKMYAKTLAEAG